MWVNILVGPLLTFLMVVHRLRQKENDLKLLRKLEE